jgi:hypothetical protein
MNEWYTWRAASVLAAAEVVSEIMQTTRDLHHLVAQSLTKVSEDILDDPKALDAGKHMLDANAKAGDELVGVFFTLGQLTTSRLLEGKSHVRSIRMIALKAKVCGQS